MLTRTSFAMLLALLAAAPPAVAQSTYVSASLFGDIVRSSHSGTVERSGAGGGEALGFALRVGTPLGGTWGVELEFARPGEVERGVSSGQLALLQQEVFVASLQRLSPTILPIVYEVRSSARHTTLAASVWHQQQLTARVALAYLGGIGFSRTTSEFEIDYGGFPRSLVPFAPTAFAAESVDYGLRPLAGFESRIALAEHAQIVPGIRMLAANGAWLVRPSIGIGWAF